MFDSTKIFACSSPESLCREAISILESATPSKAAVVNAVSTDTLARAHLMLHVVTDVDALQVLDEMCALCSGLLQALMKFKNCYLNIFHMILMLPCIFS